MNEEDDLVDKVEETPVNRSIKEMLLNIKNWFTQKKTIKMIRVVNGGKNFWVKDPKKIIYYKQIAERTGSRLLINDSNMSLPIIRITKVIYNDN